MRASPRIRLAEPVHRQGPIGRVEVAESSKPIEALTRVLKASHANENVDDGLCVQARNRSAAHVVDSADDPLADRALQFGALLVELLEPNGVVRDDSDRL